MTAFMEEYRTLREESFHARTAHQTILQWSMAAYAVIFAGALSFLGNGGPKPDSPDGLAIAVIVFGFGLPGFTIASSMSWYGELRGMARAASYIRRKEDAFHRFVQSLPHPTADTTELFELLAPNFETALARDETRIWVGYGGAFLVYVGATLISLLTFLYFLYITKFRAFTQPLLKVHGAGWRMASTIYAGSLWVSYVTTFGLSCGKQRKTGFHIRIPKNLGS